MMNKSEDIEPNAIGQTLFLFISIIFVTQSILFAFNIPVARGSIYLSLGTSLFFLYLNHKNKPKSFLRNLKPFVIFFLTIISCAILSLFFYDISGDGQWYHQEIVIRLVEGWNPFYTLLEKDFHLESMYPFVQHYPKAFEIIAAVLTKSSGLIELGKITHSIYIIAIFLLSKNIFKHLGFSVKKSFLLSALLALNPVSLAQVFSYYVDGFLASLITLSLIFLYYYHQTHERKHLLLFGLCSLQIINTKLTGFVFFGFICLTYFFFLIIQKRKPELKQFLITSVTACLLAIFLFGFHPFITNTLQKGHPLYPVFEPEKKAKEYLGDAGLPLSLQKASHGKRILVSLFSKTQTNYESYFPIKIKIPFTIHPAELRNLNKPDIRMAGFGPFFGGIIILSLVVFLLLLPKNKIFYIFIASLLTSVFIHPAAWWARFVPQLWFVPFIAIILLHKSSLKFKKAFFTSILAFLSLNISTFFGVYLAGQTYNTLKIRAQLKSLAQAEDNVVVTFDHYPSNRIRFKSWDINYTIVENKKNLPCELPFTLEGAYTQYCSAGYEKRFKANFVFLDLLEGLKKWVVKKHNDKK